jgi:hypothetical protein
MGGYRDVVTAEELPPSREIQLCESGAQKAGGINGTFSTFKIFVKSRWDVRENVDIRQIVKRECPSLFSSCRK